MIIEMRELNKSITHPNNDFFHSHFHSQGPSLFGMEDGIRCDRSGSHDKVIIVYYSYEIAYHGGRYDNKYGRDSVFMPDLTFITGPKNNILATKHKISSDKFPYLEISHHVW